MQRNEEVVGVRVQSHAVVMIPVFPGVKVHHDHLARAWSYEPLLVAPRLASTYSRYGREYYSNEIVVS